MDYRYDFAVIGGDIRQTYIANELAGKGFSVAIWATEVGNLRLTECKAADTYAEAITASNIIIAPTPFTKDGQHMFVKSCFEPPSIYDICNCLADDQIFVAGGIPAEIVRRFDNTDIELLDLMKDEELTIFNAVATAEGAIAEAILHSTGNLHGSNALVLGYGRCAKVLADKLKGISVNVTVCARKPKDISQAYALGFDTITFQALENELTRYDYIFNTVPAVMLGSEQLWCMRSDVVIIDIASAPGGVDYEAAKNMGMQAYLCLGLPGKYSPAASASAIVKTVMKRASNYF